MSKFYKPDPKAVAANMLSKYQVLIWGVNGLVEVICVSKEQDKHGVVQRDLKRIVLAFVDLHKVWI
jgi:hypothetical protein